MPLKRFSHKEPQVFLLIMLPYIVGVPLLLFGRCMVQSLPVFAKSFAVNGLYLLAAYFVFLSVALFIRSRFAAHSDLFRRIAVMLPVFYLMNIGVIKGLVLLHNHLQLLPCSIKPGMFWWTVLFSCIIGTVVTFINEGVANWEKWKDSLAETERLQNAYQRSKLLGLKGQINPHFLFNCFNTLSSLIHEDENKAERFLEEMTRVHRYLLNGNDDLLVPVSEEIKFASSYLYLTKVRFGNAIEASLQVSESAYEKLVPPLSMQVILENIIYTNALSKAEPLIIEITSERMSEIVIRHSVHEKAIAQSFEVDEGLDNLLNKYRLLNAPPITINEQTGKRVVVLPLLDKKSAL